MQSYATPRDRIAIPSSTIDAIEVIRRRCHELIAPPTHAAGIAAAEEAADRALQAQISDVEHERYGGWTEQHGPEKALYSGGGNMFYQLLALARAWATPGSRHHRDEKLRDRFLLGWRCCRRMAYPGCPFPGNWWNWQVGTPECMSEILLLDDDLLPGDQRDLFIRTLRYLVDQVRDDNPGANAMWAAMVYLRYGVIAGDAGYITRAARNVDRASAITDHQGILSDYSYSFHGRGLNLGYGSLHLEYLGRFTWLLSDSPWRLHEDTLANAASMFLEFVRWVVVRDTIDPFTVDRGISQAEDRFKASFAINAGLLLSTGPVPRRGEVLAACRWMIDQGNLPSSAVTARIAAALPAAPQPPLTGMRYFPESEYAVMRTPAWTATIKIATEKNKCYFGINKTNLKGWHTSDGQIILRFTGDEYRGNVIPTMDWERLSGITRGDGFKLPAETRGQSWYAAGAVSLDGAVGCCGMRFTIINLDRTSINAHKSWFFLGDAIVALGSAITCDGVDAVETIIRHVALPPAREDSAQEQTQKVQTELLEGHDCTYLLPDQPVITVRTQRRSGRWSDLRADEGSTQLHTRWFWTALIAHGRQPRDASYTIVYLPGMSADEARTWWEARPFEIVRCDDQMHQLIDRRRGRRMTVRQWYGAQIETTQ